MSEVYLRSRELLILKIYSHEAAAAEEEETCELRFVSVKRRGWDWGDIKFNKIFLSHQTHSFCSSYWHFHTRTEKKICMKMNVLYIFQRREFLSFFFFFPHKSWGILFLLSLHTQHTSYIAEKRAKVKHAGCLSSWLAVSTLSLCSSECVSFFFSPLSFYGKYIIYAFPHCGALEKSYYKVVWFGDNTKKALAHAQTETAVWCEVIKRLSTIFLLNFSLSVCLMCDTQTRDRACDLQSKCCVVGGFWNSKSILSYAAK